jgi:hypothetical protein
MNMTETPYDAISKSTEDAMVRTTGPDDPNSPSGGNADWSRDLIEAIAKDVGEAVVAHVETMYPAAIDATPTTFRLSLRNTVINEIMAAVAVNDAGRIVDRLAIRRQQRRKLTTAYRKMRTGDQA